MQKYFIYLIILSRNFYRNLSNWRQASFFRNSNNIFSTMYFKTCTAIKLKELDYIHNHIYIYKLYRTKL